MTITQRHRSLMLERFHLPVWREYLKLRQYAKANEVYDYVLREYGPEVATSRMTRIIPSLVRES